MNPLEEFEFDPPLDPEEKERAFRYSKRYGVHLFWGMAMALGVCRPEEIPKKPFRKPQIEGFLTAMAEQRKIYAQDKGRKQRRSNSPDFYVESRYKPAKEKQPERVIRAPGDPSAQNDKAADFGHDFV